MSMLHANWMSLCAPEEGVSQLQQYYTKDEVYYMLWKDVDLEDRRVVCSPFGGPIAVCKDPTKLVRVSGREADIQIFSAAGRSLGSVESVPGTLVQIGWSSEQRLVVVTKYGRVHMYSMFGTDHVESSISMEAEESSRQVVACNIFGDGVAVMLENFHIYCIPQLGPDPAMWRTEHIVPAGLRSVPLSLGVIPARLSASALCEVLLAATDQPPEKDEEEHEPREGAREGRDKKGRPIPAPTAKPPPAIIRCCADASRYAALSADDLPGGPFCHVSVSPDGFHVALLSADFQLMVYTQDLRLLLCQYDTGAPRAPAHVAWCGGDAIALLWDERLLLVEPSGHYVSLPVLDGELSVLVEELDGVRLISETKHELIRKVPEAVRNMYEPGSGQPVARLVTARHYLETQNPRADKLLRKLKDGGTLEAAVEECVAAAMFHLDAREQGACLRAAVYGRTFCARFPPARLHEAASALRVLNALRSPEVGMPLTAAQMDALTLRVIVSRLVDARQHLLAMRMCEVQGISAEQVVLHWATHKIKLADAETPDEVLGDLINAKMAECRCSSYAGIAKVAAEVGRRTLATLLVENESLASEQVPLLMTLGKPSLAMTKACASGDADLVYLVLMELADRRPDDIRAVLAVPGHKLARRLWDKYRAGQSLVPGEGQTNLRKLLEEEWVPKGEVMKAANSALENALSALATAPGGVRTKNAAGFGVNIQSAGKLFGSCPGGAGAVAAAALEEAQKLRRWQINKEETDRQEIYAGLSLHETYRQLLRSDRMNGHRIAADFARQFKISVAEQEWMNVQHSAHMREFDRTLRGIKQHRLVETLARETGCKVNEVWERLHCIFDEALEGGDETLRNAKMQEFVQLMPDTVEFKTKALQQLGQVAQAQQIQESSRTVRGILQQVTAGAREQASQLAAGDVATRASAALQSGYNQTVASVGSAARSFAPGARDRR